MHWVNFMRKLSLICRLASKEMIPHEVAYDDSDADSEANSDEPGARSEAGGSSQESDDDEDSGGGRGSENGYPPGGRSLHGIDPDDDYPMHSIGKSSLSAAKRRELRDVKFENILVQFCEILL